MLHPISETGKSKKIFLRISKGAIISKRNGIEIVMMSTAALILLVSNAGVCYWTRHQPRTRWRRPIMTLCNVASPLE